ncbi:hypothetical protein BKE38_00910 [Pseudoroseomonas deserti]|uniref:Nif11 domain-containing protein n=1 Tax=Teichococcus deserti TaxID=1817963 RepID=A0A1V2HAR0_9PROT|nr:hypothetical protein [Pseudoroseomonas deserti]ONG59028.1 hypothetical protein BKE38_00910 [Pseudoroseomonas deserti]
MSHAEIDRLLAELEGQLALRAAMTRPGVTLDEAIMHANAAGYGIDRRSVQSWILSRQGEMSEDQLDGLAGGASAASTMPIPVFSDYAHGL